MNCFKCNIFIFILKFFILGFLEICNYQNPNYKNENTEKKYLNNMWKKQFLKEENSLLELEKDFLELKCRESKGWEVKITKEIEELFLNQLCL